MWYRSLVPIRMFQYVSICFNMFQYVSICFNLRLRHSFQPLCFSPSTELRVVLWWQIFVTLCHSTTEPNTKASRADRPTCDTGMAQNKSNKSNWMESVQKCPEAGCFVYLCLHLFEIGNPVLHFRSARCGQCEFWSLPSCRVSANTWRLHATSQRKCGKLMKIVEMWQ
jgi:hypothetical protein